MVDSNIINQYHKLTFNIVLIYIKIDFCCWYQIKPCDLSQMRNSSRSRVRAVLLFSCLLIRKQRFCWSILLSFSKRGNAVNRRSHHWCDINVDYDHFRSHSIVRLCSCPYPHWFYYEIKCYLYQVFLYGFFINFLNIFITTCDFVLSFNFSIFLC